MPQHKAHLMSGVVGLASLLVTVAVYAEGENEAGDKAPAAAPVTRPATRPVAPLKSASKPAAATPATPKAPPRSPGKSKEIPAAVQEVVKKAVADMHKELETGQPRSRSSYFTDNPAKELTADMVFGLLERRIDPNPGADAYIKWQFLSALPSALEDGYRQRAIAVLNGAPKPAAMPGLITNEQQRRQLEMQAQRLRGPDAGDAAIKELEAARDRVRRENDPILTYRSDLLALCPENYDGVVAGFADVYTRAQAGEATGPAMDAAVRSASRWLFNRPPQQQVRQLANLLGNLQNAPLPELLKSFRWEARQGTLQLQTQKITLPAGLNRLEGDIERALSGDGNAAEGGKGRRHR